MFDFKQITPKKRILLLGFMLIVVPGVIIIYLSLESIKQKEENLKATFKGTVGLVRDKLESEVLKAEANLKNSAIEVFSTSIDKPDLEDRLKKLALENSAFNNLFLLSTNGGILSSSVSSGWIHNSESPQIKSLAAITDFNKAEKAEYIGKDYIEAVTHYQRAFNKTVFAEDQTLLLSRTGRCYFKSENYNTGIKEYKKLLELEIDDITLGNIPASIIALSQISYGYASLKDKKKYADNQIELYKKLLDHPWDLLGGEYQYYLKSAREEINKLQDSVGNTRAYQEKIGELIKKENKLIEHIRFIEHMYQDVLPNLASEPRFGGRIEIPSFDKSKNKDKPTSQIGFFKFPASFQQSDLLVMGYNFNKDYILSTLFPEILTSVALGQDVLVGVLNEKDSLLYIQQNNSLSNYLVLDHFSQLFVNWKVALFDKDGKSIEQLVGKERRLYMILFLGIIFIMIIGIIIIVRAVIHEVEVSRMKSEFVSNVSHEFKTPLALIRMFGETLDSGVVTDEKKRKEFYGIIRKESERLTHLIDDVLDFSKMDKGVKKYYFEEVDIVQVVMSSLEAYKFHIRDKGFEIESELPNEKIAVNIDKDTISQAMLNLLSNAVKYSKERKFIAIKVRRHSDSVSISVSDSGIGIAKEHLKKIFDKFYRVETAKRKERRGNGLGLTLTKHIIEAHGGAIKVKSETGKGSRFTLILPLNKTLDQR